MDFGQDALQQLFYVIVASRLHYRQKKKQTQQNDLTTCRCKKECHAQCNIDSIVISLKRGKTGLWNFPVCFNWKLFCLSFSATCIKRALLNILCTLRKNLYSCKQCNFLLFMLFSLFRRYYLWYLWLSQKLVRYYIVVILPRDESFKILCIMLYL